ncbi:hypothetical protein K458DRAFT_113957 [Lentithecium fluviatile CBS 122367]|uniref:Uncharacterized protein n=1 Tax=Lentithecium fluviatile CBS 122367 TaxID=1168545 RepID=A0A6G1INQ1_9PLEO|nr:hypothetical protein K458DRAFT_113957 [Lentithecium fluviatile CBS 122367]
MRSSLLKRLTRYLGAAVEMGVRSRSRHRNRHAVAFSDLNAVECGNCVQPHRCSCCIPARIGTPRTGRCRDSWDRTQPSYCALGIDRPMVSGICKMERILLRGFGFSRFGGRGSDIDEIRFRLRAVLIRTACMIGWCRTVEGGHTIWLNYGILNFVPCGQFGIL